MRKRNQSLQARWDAIDFDAIRDLASQSITSHVSLAAHFDVPRDTWNSWMDMPDFAEKVNLALDAGALEAEKRLVSALWGKVDEGNVPATRELLGRLPQSATTTARYPQLRAENMLVVELDPAALERKRELAGESRAALVKPEGDE